MDTLANHKLQLIQQVLRCQNVELLRTASALFEQIDDGSKSTDPRLLAALLGSKDAHIAETKSDTDLEDLQNSINAIFGGEE